MERWQGRVVVITGASRGIGEATARRLAFLGLKVAAIARSGGKLNELERSVNVDGIKGSLKAYKCDITSTSEVAATFKSIEKDLGPVSVLINNAVIFAISSYRELDLDVMRTLIENNFVGALHCIKAAMASMKNNNIDDGHFINMSCTLEDMPNPDWGLYAMCKMALNTIGYTMNKQMSKEKSHIRVTTLMPALVKTPKTIDFIRSSNYEYYLVPEDIVDTIEYVMSVPKHIKVTEMKFSSYVNVIND